jgi:hypothetical protein
MSRGGSKRAAGVHALGPAVWVPEPGDLPHPRHCAYYPDSSSRACPDEDRIEAVRKAMTDLTDAELRYQVKAVNRMLDGNFI